MIETSQCFAGTNALHAYSSVHLRPHISVRSIMDAIERVRGPLEWVTSERYEAPNGVLGRIIYEAPGRGPVIEIRWGARVKPMRRLIVRNLGRGTRALYPCTYAGNAVIVLPDGRMACKTIVIGTADPVVRKSEITLTRPPDVPSGTGPRSEGTALAALDRQVSK